MTHKTYTIHIGIGGVDLSSTTDLTCASIIIVKHGIKYVLQQYFIPSANLDFKIKDDKIPYDVWEKRGLVTICDGAKVDYTDVTQWFIRMKNDYEIATLYIGYDPWNSNYWIRRNGKLSVLIWSKLDKVQKQCLTL